MGFRKTGKTKTKGRKPRRKTGKKTTASIKTLIRKELNKNIETKQSNFSTTDGSQIPHNSFYTLDSTIFKTTNGVFDPNNNLQQSNRVGDEITLRGINFKMMLELNERYSDVTYRILLVKSARGMTPTAATLFNGLSGNKMLDTINKEKFTVLYQKWGKIKAGNFGAQTASGALLLGSGLFDAGGTNVNLYSRQTKIIKFFLTPKILQQHHIKYEDGGDVVKFFDYNLLIYAYSNLSTSEGLNFNVLTVNDYMRCMYYKDA